MSTVPLGLPQQAQPYGKVGKNVNPWPNSLRNAIPSIYSNLARKEAMEKEGKELLKQFMDFCDILTYINLNDKIDDCYFFNIEIIQNAGGLGKTVNKIMTFKFFKKNKVGQDNTQKDSSNILTSMNESLKQIQTDTKPPLIDNFVKSDFENLFPSLFSSDPSTILSLPWPIIETILKQSHHISYNNGTFTLWNIPTDQQNAEFMIESIQKVVNGAAVYKMFASQMNVTLSQSPNVQISLIQSDLIETIRAELNTINDKATLFVNDFRTLLNTVSNEKATNPERFALPFVDYSVYLLYYVIFYNLFTSYQNTEVQQLEAFLNYYKYYTSGTDSADFILQQFIAKYNSTHPGNPFILIDPERLPTQVNDDYIKALYVKLVKRFTINYADVYYELYYKVYKYQSIIAKCNKYINTVNRFAIKCGLEPIVFNEDIFKSLQLKVGTSVFSETATQQINIAFQSVERSVNNFLETLAKCTIRVTSEMLSKQYIKDPEDFLKRLFDTLKNIQTAMPKTDDDSTLKYEYYVRVTSRRNILSKSNIILHHSDTVQLFQVSSNGIRSCSQTYVDVNIIDDARNVKQFQDMIIKNTETDHHFVKYIPYKIEYFPMSYEEVMSELSFFDRLFMNKKKLKQMLHSVDEGVIPEMNLIVNNSDYYELTPTFTAYNHTLPKLVRPIEVQQMLGNEMFNVGGQCILKTKRTKKKGGCVQCRRKTLQVNTEFRNYVKK